MRHMKLTTRQRLSADNDQCKP